MGFFDLFRKSPSLIRERVIELADEGLTPAEIGQELSISPTRASNILGYQTRKEKRGNPIVEFFTAYRQFKEFETNIKKEVMEELEEKDNTGEWISELLPVVKPLIQQYTQRQGGNDNVRNGPVHTGSPPMATNNTPTLPKPKGRPRKTQPTTQQN